MANSISRGQVGSGVNSNDVILHDFAAVSTGQTVSSGLSESPYDFPASEGVVFCSGFTVGPDPEQQVYFLSESDGDPAVTLEFWSCASPGDTLLPYALPQAEYMYGCTATSVGMLLGYYDLYGYSFNNGYYDFSDLIEGTVSVDSRGSDGGSIYDMDDPSVLARFIASPEYVSRFYDQTPEHELPYTYVDSDPDQGLNISVWNCLADYLGTGQYWRGNDDLSTTMCYVTLDDLLNNDFIDPVIDSYTIPAKYLDFKYGLYLYAVERGFQLDTTATRTVEIEDFSFEDLKAEIDAGRPVLLSMKSGDYGHMVIAYGYNAASQEVIFDDTYHTGCRMEWDGTYNYSGNDYALNAVSPVVFDVSNLTPESSKVETYMDDLLVSAANVMTGKTLDGMEQNRMEVYSGGIVSDTIVSDWSSLNVSSGGTANSTVVNANGSMYVSDGGVATEIVENGGYVEVEYGAEVTFKPNTISDIVLSGAATVHSGTTANAVTVSDWGTLNVSSGGTANSTVVNANGSMYVSYEGTATEIVENGGCVSVEDGAEVTFKPNTISGLEISNDATVHSGTTANAVTVSDWGTLNVYSGGTANSTIVNAYGNMFVDRGGKANGITLNSRGSLQVYSGGTALNVNWTPCVGKISAKDTAIVTYTSQYEGVYFGSNNTLLSSAMTMSGKKINGSMYVMKNGTANSNTVRDASYLDVWSGGTANSNTVEYGGILLVSSGGTANSTINANGVIYVHNGGTANSTINEWNMTILRGGTANNTTVNSGGWMDVFSGGTANSTTVNENGSLNVESGGKVTGTLTIAAGAVVSAEDGSIFDFDISGRTVDSPALVNDLSLIWGTPAYTITVSADQAEGQYTLAGGAAGFAGTLSLGTADTNYGTITVNGDSLTYDAVIYTLATADSDLLLTVENHNLGNLQGDPSGLSWTGDSAGYEVQYSTDDFAAVLQIAPGTSALDSYGLPEGTYRWRVCSTENGEWVQGNNFAADAAGTVPQLLQSDADGDMDVFFAQASGTWSESYYAQHQGSLDGWEEGTMEMVALTGKNRIADIFEGSDDANVLLLTDDANGDALFVDDIYSALPGTVAEQQSRIAKINEIRAGAGNDIVDLTSQRFGYRDGEKFLGGVKVSGGDGNDTIWANCGDNKLFGDAGDDRLVGASGDDVLVGGIGNDSMHGGGGNDIFAFGANWGNDTVEQLANGEVTLWFASGDISKWDADSLTYADGENSVQVTGVTADQVTLKFGDDGTEEYIGLSEMGAFADAVSEKIYEDKDKGMLA